VTQVIQHGQVWDHSGDPNAANLGQLFMTSLPPYQWGPEVFPVYIGFANPPIHIFGWSCTVADPCDVMVDSPTEYPFTVESTTDVAAYVVFDVFLNRFPQWQFQWIDEQGYMTHGWRYRSAMAQSGGTMTITVSFWNKLTTSWDPIWSHSRAEADPDCVPAEGGGCGNWGPSYELITTDGMGGECNPADCPPPALTKRIGYEALTVTHDNGTSIMLPSETINSPASGHLGDTRIASWRVFTPTPNRSHFAGPSNDPQVVCRMASRRRGEHGTAGWSWGC
jgi:hypothetical protein